MEQPADPARGTTLHLNAGESGTLQFCILGKTDLNGPFNNEWFTMVTWSGVRVSATGEVTITGPGHVQDREDAGELTRHVETHEHGGASHAAFAEAQMTLARGGAPGQAISFSSQGVGTSYNPTARAIETGSSPAFRVTFAVDGARAAAPAVPADPAATPAPAPARPQLTPPATREFLFAAERDIERDPDEVVQWIAGWNPDVVGDQQRPLDGDLYRLREPLGD